MRLMSFVIIHFTNMIRNASRDIEGMKIELFEKDQAAVTGLRKDVNDNVCRLVKNPNGCILNIFIVSMKSFIISLFFLLCSTVGNAQKLNVDKFVVKSNDITARTHPRQDINGNDCALVKVQLAAPNAIFDGNVIGDVTYDTSEYMVYLSQGSKRLTVKMEGYLPLEVNFDNFGISSLESKTVYVMTISGLSGPKQLEAPKIKTGWIILDSKPSGATVFINDDFVGNTPLTNYKQVYGTYTYRIDHPNYHSATGTIELNTSKTEKTIELRPAFGAIAITSSVTGAKVLLDGKATNKVTPCTLEEVPSGPHTIMVQKDKYSPRQQNVTVEDGKTSQLSLSLDARFAKDSITSFDGAQIYCNGELKGTTKHTEDMMEGYYDIEARLAHHKSATKQIKVIAGQSQEVSLTPTPIYGSLDITSTPHNAEVFIDGNYYGKTPLTIEHLMEGDHTIVLKRDGYSKESLTTKVYENQNSTSFIQMKKDFDETKTKDVTETIAGKKVNTAKDEYDSMDVRVRLGPYKIVGLDKIVKVKEGDDLIKISRRILGPNMECYLEVYNNIKASTPLKVGQEIKIPKLEWKKKKKAGTAN